jgi:hypothetical protein
MMDAGTYEEFSFDMVEFDHFIPELLLNEGARKQENGVSLAFMLALIMVFLLSGYISPVRV